VEEQEAGSLPRGAVVVVKPELLMKGGSDPALLCADPSTAMVEPPCVTGQGVKPRPLGPFSSLASHAYAPSIWMPPCTLARVNVAAVQPSFPRRAVAPRRLDVVCRRQAKGCSFPCLGKSWIRSDLVEVRFESQL
jgi:hypothetical protein